MVEVSCFSQKVHSFSVIRCTNVKSVPNFSFVECLEVARLVRLARLARLARVVRLG